MNNQYQESTMQNEVNTPYTGSYPIGSVGHGLLNEPAKLASTAQPASRLQQELNEHGEQLAKLGEMLSMLSNRLEPVRNQQNGNEAAGENVSVPATSLVVSQLLRQTTQVKQMQAAVRYLLEDLEV